MDVVVLDHCFSNYGSMSHSRFCLGEGGRLFSHSTTGLSEEGNLPWSTLVTVFQGTGESDIDKKENICIIIESTHCILS